MKKVWQTHGKFNRHDVVDGRLVITPVRWRTLLWPLWRWLTTPIRIYQLVRWGN